MIGLFRVKGHSMEPAFRNGDKLLVSSLLFKLKKDDVIVFKNGNRDYLKRIKAVFGKSGFLVTGDNKGNTGSWKIARKQIKGKLLMKY